MLFPMLLDCHVRRDLSRPIQISVLSNGFYSSKDKRRPCSIPLMQTSVLCCHPIKPLWQIVLQDEISHSSASPSVPIKVRMCSSPPHFWGCWFRSFSIPTLLLENRRESPVLESGVAFPMVANLPSGLVDVTCAQVGQYGRETLRPRQADMYRYLTMSNSCPSCFERERY